MPTRLLSAVLCLLASLSAFGKPLALYPKNPHCFLWKGRPAILITSGEHYGTVLNLDFDYLPYLDELHAKGLNLTRTFSGAYVEPSGAFNISRNTLAPGPGRFISPWARSNVPGYPNGGNKFDLNKWDDRYFARLKDFVRQAGKRGVVVELNLFCPFYEEKQWELSPQNRANNVNGIGAVARTNVYTLDKSGGLLAVHGALARKIVTELAGFDNLYFEICNEPYFGGVTLEWQHHIAEVITETEKSLGRRRHLISQNIANGSAVISKPDPLVSIFNFHYANPPGTVALNFGLNKALGDNETGFRGTNDLPYRVEAWSFILAGGALYNNLDYSFVAGKENGTYVDYPAKQPGGGNPELRKQFGVLSTFINRFNFAKMIPDKSFIKAVTPDMAVWALSRGGLEYAIYFGPQKAGQAPRGPVSVSLDLPKGDYRFEWINTKNGKVEKSVTINGGKVEKMTSPDFEEDIALSVMRL